MYLAYRMDGFTAPLIDVDAESGVIVSSVRVYWLNVWNAVTQRIA